MKSASIVSYWTVVAMISAGACDPLSEASFELSTYNLGFVAEDRCTTPKAQVVMGTVRGVNTDEYSVFARATATGPAVMSVSRVEITSRMTGMATVFPAPADKLGAGMFLGSIAVHVCVDDPMCATGQLPGSPKTIGVTYQIPEVGVIDDPTAHTVAWEIATRSLPAFHELGLAAMGSTLYAVGFRYGDVFRTWRSTDFGATWTDLMVPGPSAGINSFAIASDDAALYLSGGVAPPGGQSEVWKFDGAGWTRIAATTALPWRQEHAMIKRGTTLFVLGGRKDLNTWGTHEVFASNDEGVTWKWVGAPGSPFTDRYGLCALSFGDSLYVFGGQSVDFKTRGDAWRSTDGAKWTQVTLPERFERAVGSLGSRPHDRPAARSSRCAAVGGRIYSIGRRPATQNNCQAAAISSADGSAWTFEPPIPADSRDEDIPGAAVVGDRIYVATIDRTTASTVIWRSSPR